MEIKVKCRGLPQIKMTEVNELSLRSYISLEEYIAKLATH